MLSSHYEIAAKYAQALFELGEEEKSLSKVEESLNFVVELFNSNAVLKEFLNNPCVSKGARTEAVLGILKGQIETITLNFVLVLVEKRLDFLLPTILKCFNGFMYEKEGITQVKVTTARVLSDSEYEGITTRLSKMLNKPIVLDKHVDESIIGGIIIQVGDKLLNGSVRNKVNDYSRLLRRVNADEQEVV